MRILFKLVILGFFGLMVLPAFAPEQYRSVAEDNEPSETPTAMQVAAFVGGAAADIRSICERQPAVCATGGEILSFAGSRAREGLEVAYAMFRHGHPSMREPEDAGKALAE